jgi:hypothetical protein
LIGPVSCLPGLIVRRSRVLLVAAGCDQWGVTVRIKTDDHGVGDLGTNLREARKRLG